MLTKKLMKKKFVILPILITIVMASVISGCSSDVGTGEPQGSEVLTESRGEHGSEGEGSGEHGSGGEGGSEHGSGESGESGGESGHSEGGEGGEGGGANALMLNQTYDVTRNGARLVLAYDQANNTFVGTVQNTTNSTLTRVRVEIHLSNGTELGPTTPTDLAPGEILQINLPATSQAFDTWNPHAVVGSGEGGGEASGHAEGGEGGGEAGEVAGHPEGGEGGSEGSESGLETLMSSPVTPVTQSWSGNLGGLDVTGSYDANAKTFTTVVTNTLPYKLCYVQTEPHLKMGANTVGELGPDMIGDLNPGETKTSVIYLANEPGMAGVQFEGYTMHMEVFSCSGPGPGGGAPTINPLTGLPGGGEGGTEGGAEGAEGGEGGGAAALAPNETYDVTNNGARLVVVYDANSNSFVGFVINTTSNNLSQVRVEVHLFNGTELGPTTRTDLAPGEILGIRLPATNQVFDSWSPMQKLAQAKVAVKAVVLKAQKAVRVLVRVAASMEVVVKAVVDKSIRPPSKNRIRSARQGHCVFLPVSNQQRENRRTFLYLMK
jgi:hypothetical protein